MKWFVDVISLRPTERCTTDSGVHGGEHSREEDAPHGIVQAKIDTGHGEAVSGSSAASEALNASIGTCIRTTHISPSLWINHQYVARNTIPRVKRAVRGPLAWVWRPEQGAVIFNIVGRFELPIPTASGSPTYPLIRRRRTMIQTSNICQSWTLVCCISLLGTPRSLWR